MIWLFKLIIFGKWCEHEWVNRSEFVTNVYDSDNKNKLPINTVDCIIQQCSKCGELKQTKFSRK